MDSLTERRGAKGVDSVSILVHEPDRCSSISGAVHEQPQNDGLVIAASILMNVVLLVGKVAACIIVTTPVIVATLVDSTVDLFIQAALFWADRVAQQKAKAASSLYPAGLGQLEPVSVVVCAALKCAGMLAVAVEAMGDLWAGDPHRGRDTHGLEHIWLRHFEAVCALTVISAAKFGFCVWCELVVRGRRSSTTETVRAVLADNRNDAVLSSGALVALIFTQLSSQLWWVDAAAALLLGAYIAARWVSQGRQQVEMILGRAADPSFLEMVREISETHDPCMSLDTVRAYHFGPRFLVELEVVMDEHTELRESHDCGILLQHKIEALPQVERCFVHCDYQRREADDHDIATPVTWKMHASHALSPLRQERRDGGADIELSEGSLAPLLPRDGERCRGGSRAGTSSSS